MSDELIDPAVDDSAAISSPSDPHADKFNDPRAKITKRGILLGVLVAIFAVVGASASIYFRRIQKQQTTRFWGAETITGLLLAERIELLPADGKTVNLTATPGLGHLRRALLEDNNFDWSTVVPRAATEGCGQSDSLCVQLRLSDPNAHRIGTVEIALDLNNGWLGPSDGSRRVKATERTRTALKHTLSTLMHVEQKRYDLRD